MSKQERLIAEYRHACRTEPYGSGLGRWNNLPEAESFARWLVEFSGWTVEPPVEPTVPR